MRGSHGNRPGARAFAFTMDPERDDWLAMHRLRRLSARMRQHDNRFGLVTLAAIQDDGAETIDTYRWLAHAEYRRVTQRGENVAEKCTAG